MAVGGNADPCGRATGLSGLADRRGRRAAVSAHFGIAGRRGLATGQYGTRHRANDQAHTQPGDQPRPGRWATLPAKCQDGRCGPVPGGGSRSAGTFANLGGALLHSGHEVIPRLGRLVADTERTPGHDGAR